MIQQKALILNGQIIKIGNDYEIDQFEEFNTEYLRVNIDYSLKDEDVSYLQYKNKKVSINQDLKSKIKRKEKLEKIRQVRNSKLSEADVLILKAEDNNQSTEAIRSYRVALRNITENFKDENGEPKENLDLIDLENFEYPSL